MGSQGMRNALVNGAKVSAIFTKNPCHPCTGGLISAILEGTLDRGVTLQPCRFFLDKDRGFVSFDMYTKVGYMTHQDVSTLTRCVECINNSAHCLQVRTGLGRFCAISPSFF
jgi:hypothetical protein